MDTSTWDKFLAQYVAALQSPKSDTRTGLYTVISVIEELLLCSLKHVSAFIYNISITKIS